MTAEEEGTIQVNVRLYKTQVEEVDKLLKESKFKSRSEYLRDLIESHLKGEESKEQIEDNLMETERILNSFKTIKESLKALFDQADIDPKMKEDALAVLIGEEEVKE